MRILALLICLTAFCACGNSTREKAQEREQVEQEIVTDSEPSEEPQPYKEPDGAFGAKDFATEAKEMSDRSTREVEEAAQTDPNEDE